MKANTDERLDSLIESLNADISFLRASGWNDSARLLEMAKLEIQMQGHSISDQELREFCAAIGPEGATTTAAISEASSATIDAVASQKQIARNSTARVVVPIAPNIRRARSARKHAR
jgi:16S rRNA U1498 N3-methylase RsmE